MKIYISVDMEGISGINTKDHVLKDGRLYPEARRMLTEDINAAVRGAFNGGADEVIVADKHSISNNLLTEMRTACSCWAIMPAREPSVRRLSRP